MRTCNNTNIQHAFVDGQHTVTFGLADNGKYVVQYGEQEKFFPRTPTGLSEAVKEFESCYAHALMCACPDDLDD